MPADTELRLNLLAKDSTGQATNSAASNLRDVGDAADDAAKSTGKLDQASAKTVKSIKSLDFEIGKVKTDLTLLHGQMGEATTAAERMDISKGIRKSEAELRRLTKSQNFLKALLPEPSAIVQAGSDTGMSLGSSIMAGLRGAAPAVGPVLAGVVAASLPLLGATVAGAIVGGAGIGGVVGGVMLAVKDPAVKSAGADLGKSLMADLQSRAKVFVGPVLDAISDIQSKYKQMGGDLSRIFGNSAKLVAPLVAGVTQAIQRITAGIADLTDAAGPVVESISNGFARVGDAVGDVFHDLKDNGVEAALALNAVFGLVEGAIRAVGAVVNALADSFGFLAKFGAFGSQVQAQYLLMEAGAKSAAGAQKDVASSSGPAKAGIVEVGGAASDAKQPVYDYAAALEKVYDNNLSLFDSDGDVQEALEKTRETFSKTKKATIEAGNALSTHTKQGRENRDALSGLAKQLTSNYQATLAVNGQGARTDEVAKRNRDSFYRLALQITGNATKARALTNTLLGIPNITRNVKINGVDGAKAAARTISNTLRAIKDERVNIIYQTGYGSTVSSSALRSAFNKNAREYGGPVKTGKAYIVGEKRAEVFVPDQDGKIIPSVEQFNRGAFQGSSGGPSWSGGGSGGGTMRLVVSGGNDDWLYNAVNYGVRTGRIQVQPT